MTINARLPLFALLLLILNLPLAPAFASILRVPYSTLIPIIIGIALFGVYSVENSIRLGQMFTERFTGVWNIGYSFRGIGLSVDYTGNVYSPMRLPLLSDTDPP